jgi:hypothetical protein
MFQYRQVLARLRAGDSERDIARSKLMSRQKLAALRALAAEQGWLDLANELPDEATIAAAVGAGRRACSTVSSVEPWRELVVQWQAAGVQGKAIHAALKRQHGYAGSYSSVARMLVSLRGQQPVATTVRLSFEPGEAAQCQGSPNSPQRAPFSLEIRRALDIKGCFFSQTSERLQRRDFKFRFRRLRRGRNAPVGVHARLLSRHQ